MKTFLASLVLCLLPAVAAGADGVVAPPWAYPATEPDFPREPDDGLPKHVPGSDQAFKRREITDFFAVKDWFPDEHPLMSEIVEHGRKPEVRACGVCHLPNGLGHPDTAYLAGLPADYFFQQLKDLQSGTRKNAFTPPSNNGMSMIAAAMTDEEMKIAASYFAGLKPQPWVSVKESATGPVTFVGNGNLRLVKPNGGTEPLGQRIIEVPENSELAELRDPHSGFIAYVPFGSVKKGEALVTTGGNGKTVSCAICHGPDLKGLGNVPGIAGRSPIYVVRQLLDIKQGFRDAPATQLMKAVVAKLTPDDILNVAAYTASRRP